MRGKKFPVGLRLESRQFHQAQTSQRLKVVTYTRGSIMLLYPTVPAEQTSLKTQEKTMLDAKLNAQKSITGICRRTFWYNDAIFWDVDKLKIFKALYVLVLWINNS